MLDYDIESGETRLVELRLHQPVDVHVRKETFKDARDLCFTNVRVFVCELGSKAIRVIDLEGKVRLKPEGLKSRAELLSRLGRFSLPQEGTMPILGKRLATHLQALAAQVKNPEIVQLNTPSVKPTSICVASTDILLCADDEHQRIIQLELGYNGVAVVGTSMREINYPDGVSSIESLCGDGQHTWLHLVKQVGYTTVTSQIQTSNSSCGIRPIHAVKSRGCVIMATSLSSLTL